MELRSIVLSDYQELIKFWRENYSNIFEIKSGETININGDKITAY